LFVTDIKGQAFGLIFKGLESWKWKRLVVP